MKTLIAYFSRGGTTAKVTEDLKKYVDGRVFEIKGNKKYGNYFHALGVARQEFSSGELPEVVKDVRNFDSYDRILIGFPIWYSKAPQLVISFLTAHDLAGKEVFPYCTSGMSGPEGAKEQLKEACKGAVMHPGIRFAKVDEKTVKAWLDAPAC